MIPTSRVATAAILALSGLSTAAFAFDRGGLNGTGRIELEYADIDGKSYPNASGDISLSWRSGAVLGFDAALDTTVLLDDGDDFTNIWGALVLSTSVGNFSIGAPQPVTETLKVMPELTSARIIGVEFGPLIGPKVVTDSYFDTGMTPGLAFTSTTGDLRYGLSYHQIDAAITTIDYYEGAMVFVGDRNSYFIMGELARYPGDDETMLQIGAQHQADRYSFGAALTRAEFSSVSRSSLRLYGGYDLLPALTVKGDYLIVDNFDDLFSVSAEYRIGDVGYVEGGATYFSDDMIYDIGLGLKF
ncbi:MAG: hypothetical protein WAT09_19115 [Paracoccaceae bacterium]